MASQGQPPPSSQSSGLFKTSDGRTIEIREVWASNLDAEMEIIRDCLEKYKFVAMVFDYNLHLLC